MCAGRTCTVPRRPRRAVARMAEPLQPCSRRCREQPVPWSTIMIPREARRRARLVRACGDTRGSKSRGRPWVDRRGRTWRARRRAPRPPIRCSVASGSNGTSSGSWFRPARSVSRPPPAAAASAAPFSARPPGPSRSCPTRRCRGAGERRGRLKAARSSFFAASRGDASRRNLGDEYAAAAAGVREQRAEEHGCSELCDECLAG